jgi:hypothetical protein
VGDGQVVLVHVTANAEWSSLPLSGLFVQMLERLAVSTRPAMPEAADLAGQVWVPEELLDAWGARREAGAVAGVDGEVLARAIAEGPGPDQPPGLYAGLDRRVALNVIAAETALEPAVWPASAKVETLEVAPERSLKGGFLTAALAMLLVDVLAALWVAGRLSGLRRGAAVLAACRACRWACRSGRRARAGGGRGAAARRRFRHPGHHRGGAGACADRRCAG